MNNRSPWDHKTCNPVRSMGYMYCSYNSSGVSRVRQLDRAPLFSDQF